MANVEEWLQSAKWADWRAFFAEICEICQAKNGQKWTENKPANHELRWACSGGQFAASRASNLHSAQLIESLDSCCCLLEVCGSLWAVFAWEQRFLVSR